MSKAEFDALSISVFPNPGSDLIAIQFNGLVNSDFKIELLDMAGKVIRETKINKGTTIAYFDTNSLYEGTYIVRISNHENVLNKRALVKRV